MSTTTFLVADSFLSVEVFAVSATGVEVTLGSTFASTGFGASYGAPTTVVTIANGSATTTVSTFSSTLSDFAGTSVTGFESSIPAGPTTPATGAAVVAGVAAPAFFFSSSSSALSDSANALTISSTNYVFWLMEIALTYS